MRSPEHVLDFRQIIRELPLGGRTLDPGDVNAHRCTWGGVVTADESEAEIALAPLRRKPGFVSRLERHAASARAALKLGLPAGVDITGYSTHLSFSMPGTLNIDACRRFLSSFAPGVMLLGDRVDSPGLLVRPRSRRLELAFEYVDGAQLGGVAAFATGAAMAVGAAASGAASQPMPPAVRAFGVATGDRYGWGLARDAFGADLLRDGRDALLLRVGGGTIRAQDHLELSWQIARDALARTAAERDLASADALVAGRVPVPSERVISFTSVNSTDAFAVWPRRSAYGDVLRSRQRGALTITAEIATWDTTVFAVAGPWRRAFAAVPRESLPRFLRALDTGRLDAVLTAYLDARPEGRVLASWSDALRPGLFDALAPARQMLAPEVAPQDLGTEWIATDRPGKFETPREGRTLPLWPLIGIIGLLLIGIAFALTRGGGETPATPTESAPGAAPTPAAPKVTRFTATFAAPVTSYQVDVTDPAGGGLTYVWTDSNPCGAFVFQGAQAQWIHPDPPCPNEPIHAAAIVVKATDTLGRTATFTYTGGSAPADIRP